MIGAQALMKTLADAGVTVCFCNPGTSEMHFVAALDAEPRMRAVLTLFEGVATGAADGYARMAGKPAATLLHLGCGLGNGLANLHNARKGRVPVINIVGDHATYHVKYDAQLQSDIETVARNVSTWVRTSASTADLGADAAEAIGVAMGTPAQVATLILPADVSWGEGGVPATVPEVVPPPVADDAVVDAMAQAIRSGEPAAMLLGARALREPALLAASRVAQKSGVKLFAEVFPTRIERGAGLPHVERIAYLAELAGVQLQGLKHLILVDAKSPVSFFAYPGKASDLVPKGCRVHVLASLGQDALGGLIRLASKLDADTVLPLLEPANPPPAPRGRLTAEKVCKAVGHLLPERAIIVDEAQTSGVMLPHFTRGAPRHDVITLTGGAIGQGLPNAVGAAIACPDRPVLALVGDGSAMYTIQALWTMARERLNVTTIVFNNHAYAILNVELQRVGAQGSGEKARAQFDLGNPGLDFVQLGASMGVHAVRATTAEGFTAALAEALRNPGPHLIEAVVPSAFTGLKLRLLPHVLGSLASLPAPVARAIKRKVAP
ncbi:acetolactate synthase large subunit [Aquabacterium fontiphilum]|jgi:acetolactate synthase-1/2/3 large subunit|uniref:acetolactate synthase large subunit n=1 Tax=Aquabacterium fontiphilum TaxID=450365 RepID=UPI001376646E|nr:acetolactate synthase large subunit [Aquabacterium fontiphilum]NBD19087.1 acetolactate synthase large subunit [Aquabacterium fontiphilum]